MVQKNPKPRDLEPLKQRTKTAITQSVFGKQSSCWHCRVATVTSHSVIIHNSGFYAIHPELQPPKCCKSSHYDGDDTVKYGLITHEEANSDAMQTQYRCRFEVLDYEQQTATYRGETLSLYPFHYNVVNWRKKKQPKLED
jgi:hypothetical protein